MSGASRIFSGELGTVRVFAALGAAGLPELYSTFMLLVWPSLAAGALALKERILVSPPGRRFSSISFFLSSSPAVRPSVSSLSVTTMLCMECSRSVVLRLGMNLSPTPLDFRDMPPVPRVGVLLRSGGPGTCCAAPACLAAPARGTPGRQTATC